MKTTKLLTTLLILAISVSMVFSQTKNKPSLATLTQGQLLNGFTVKSVYLNASDQPMGARFIHAKTGFVLDILQIESVPQVFIWTGTQPISDKGEPHTQEHLLITKGNKGHELNTREGMSLAVSNAFTTQLHTAYLFYTGAGPEVFYTLFQGYMDALLYPDYADEEIKREVRNWGVSLDENKRLKLEEKGSVYNEMSTGMKDPGSTLYDELNRELYGRQHPLAYNAGGLPSGIREMTPENIKAYHEANYHLGNMGAIVSAPRQMELNSVLQRMNNILVSLNRPSQQNRPAQQALPAPQGAKFGEIRAIKVSQEDVNQPGTMIIAYPPTLNLSVQDNMELSYFMETFAGNATTNLYKLLVDSKTHMPGFVAEGVYSGVSNDQGNPVTINLEGVNPEYLTTEKSGEIRKLINAELQKIAAWAGNSPELLEFNKRCGITITSNEKSYNKFINTPPQFGARSTGDSWYAQLDFLAQQTGFKKSIVFKPQISVIRKKLASGLNIWRDILAKGGMITRQPYVLFMQTDPSLAKTTEEERLARVKNETERLKKLYNTTDDQQAIARYQKSYDDNTAKLEEVEKGHHIGFIRNPPLTMDDQLDYRQEKIAGSVPLIKSVFNNMSSATAGIALNMQGISPNKLQYLALLPQLISATGVLRNGQAVSYPDMLQQIQQQILSLNCYYSTNLNNGRVEFVVKASGGNASESAKAVEWMEEVLQHPNWTIDNLPRLRDLVAQAWGNARRTMQGAEESWVNNPFNAYRGQDQPLFLSVSSFLTGTYNIFKVKWMLKDGNNKDLSAFLSSLAAVKPNRQELVALLAAVNTGKLISEDAPANSYAKLDDAGKKLAKEAASDLAQLLNDIPDNALDTDWKMLCETIIAGLMQGPQKTLSEWNELRTQMLQKDNVRVFIIGSTGTCKQMGDGIETMINRFGKQPLVKQQYANDKHVDERMKTRMHTSERPVYVGLINPNSTTGVFINSAPLVGFKDTTKEKLIQFLAAALYAGAGKESVYTKTTGAGLSYSTGVSASSVNGRFRYYAERTPELPQTLSFVIDEIKKSPVDPEVIDYLIAEAVGFTRSAGTYESRGETMANDITDGYTDAVVKKFRQSIIKLRDAPNLVQQVYAQKTAVYEKILPGYGKPGSTQPGNIYFVIGPEKQMVAYEAYLKRVDEASTKLYRLYPRDFWMVK